MLGAGCSAYPSLACGNSVLFTTISPPPPRPVSSEIARAMLRLCGCVDERACVIVCPVVNCWFTTVRARYLLDLLGL